MGIFWFMLVGTILYIALLLLDATGGMDEII